MLEQDPPTFKAPDCVYDRVVAGFRELFKVAG